jgi:hypothetical protein
VTPPPLLATRPAITEERTEEESPGPKKQAPRNPQTKSRVRAWRKLLRGSVMFSRLAVQRFPSDDDSSSASRSGPTSLQNKEFRENSCGTSGEQTAALVRCLFGASAAEKAVVGVVEQCTEGDGLFDEEAALLAHLVELSGCVAAFVPYRIVQRGPQLFSQWNGEKEKSPWGKSIDKCGE